MDAKEILRFIYDNDKDPNGSYVDVLDYFINKYPDPSGNTLKDAVIALTELINRKLIRLSDQNTYKYLGSSKSSIYDKDNPDKIVVINFEELNKWSKASSQITIAGIKAKIKYDGRKEAEQFIFSEQIIEVNKSLIKTNESISNLNTETEKFYTNQKEYNKTQKDLTWVIAIAGGLYTIIAAATFFKSDSERNSKPQQDKYIQLQTKLQSIDNTLKSHIILDSSFQKQVKDSLKISP